MRPITGETTKWWHFWKYITVEPVITLYMLAFMITAVVEQSFFVNKACRVDHNFSVDICNNINKPEHKNYSDQVQVTVSTFHQWNNVTGHFIPIILALFMGAWSDRRGRKLPLIFGLCGKLYYSCLIIVNSLQPTWPLHYVIYTATLPSTITGLDVTIFAAGLSYLSDVTNIEKRTLRITILDICYLSTMPSGIALGRYLFSDVTNRSYSILFGINASLLVLAILYTFVALKWTTTNRQKTICEAKVNIFVDFFDKDHVVKTYQSITKWRPDNRRTYLIIIILMMMFYTFQRDEKEYAYLFFTKVSHWNDNQYSNFRTFQSCFYVIVMLIAAPIMNRVLGLRDTVIIMFGSFSHTLCRIIFVFGRTNWLYYLGAVISALGPIVAPAIRSMTSKIVSMPERGRVFSVLSVAENAVPFISGILYTQVYNATIKTYPEGIFWLTIATQVIVFVSILFIHLKTNDMTLRHQEISESQSKCIEESSNENIN